MFTCHHRCPLAHLTSLQRDIQRDISIGLEAGGGVFAFRESAPDHEVADSEPGAPGEQRQHGLDSDQAVLCEGVRRPDLSAHSPELTIQGHICCLWVTMKSSTHGTIV